MKITEQAAAAEAASQYAAEAAANGARSFRHVPASVTRALRQYAADVKAGKITFDAEGFAGSYPSQRAGDASLTAWIRFNTHRSEA